MDEAVTAEHDGDNVGHATSNAGYAGSASTARPISEPPTQHPHLTRTATVDEVIETPAGVPIRRYFETKITVR